MSMKRPDDTDPRSIRYRMRKARFQHIERLLDGILAEKETATILDIGGRRDYWKLLDPSYRSRIRLTILNIEDEVSRENLDEDIQIEIETRIGDGTSMPEIGDNSYDLAHSNSVIEHVGLYKDMVNFASETRRVGKAYYLQTPNFWFPLEPHYGVPFFHWLPEPVRIALHTKMRVGFAHRTKWPVATEWVDYTRIITRNMLHEMFPDGMQKNEKFLFMTKSLIVFTPYPIVPSVGL